MDRTSKTKKKSLICQFQFKRLKWILVQHKASIPSSRPTGPLKSWYKIKATLKDMLLLDVFARNVSIW